MMQNICRICAIETSEADPTKLFDISTRNLLRQITLITGVFLEAKPDLPQIICEICEIDLDCAMEFRRRCLRSHKRWTPSSELLSDTETESSTSSKRVICVRRGVRTRAHCANGNENNEAPLSSDEVLIKVEHAKQNADGDDNVDHLNLETTDNATDFSVLEDKLYAPKVRSTRRQRNVNKSTASKEPGNKQKPAYFCDQCGKNIKGKCAFDRHLAKHSGIKPFTCKNCSARFYSAGELKGHQVMHTGDRNYPCRFCERTYVNYSGRMRHERIHTNDRPFACTQCDKAFTTSYILKNHMLVHTGERMFRCELCQRSFSRSTHLKTHYRSNAHKQNTEKSRASQRHHPLGQDVHLNSEVNLKTAPVIVLGVEGPINNNS